jgi:hypothetical protein
MAKAKTGYIVRVDTASGRTGISKHYQTVRGAIKYYARKFADGEPCTVEVFHDARLLHLSAPWVLNFDERFERV